MLVDGLRRLAVALGGVEEERPIDLAATGAEAEGDGSVAGVQQDKEGAATDRLATLIAFADLVAKQAHAKAAGVGASPIAFCHFHAIWSEPVDVLDVGAVDGSALEKMSAAKDGLIAPEFDE